MGKKYIVSFSVCAVDGNDKHLFNHAVNFVEDEDNTSQLGFFWKFAEFMQVFGHRAFHSDEMELITAVLCGEIDIGDFRKIQADENGEEDEEKTPC